MTQGDKKKFNQTKTLLSKVISIIWHQNTFLLYLFFLCRKLLKLRENLFLALQKFSLIYSNAVK